MFSTRLRIPAGTLSLTVLLLAACSDEAPVTPADPEDTEAKLLLAGMKAPKSHRHVVVLTEGGDVDALAADVQAMGGAFERSHDGIGVATVSGLTDLKAASLAAVREVQDGFGPGVQVRGRLDPQGRRSIGGFVHLFWLSGPGPTVNTFTGRRQGGTARNTTNPEI